MFADGTCFQISTYSLVDISYMIYDIWDIWINNIQTVYNVWGAATNQLTDRTTVTGQDSSVGVIWRFSGRHGLNQKQAYSGASRWICLGLVLVLACVQIQVVVKVWAIHEQYNTGILYGILLPKFEVIRYDVLNDGYSVPGGNISSKSIIHCRARQVHYIAIWLVACAVTCR